MLAKYPNINQVPYNSKPVGIGPFRVVAWHRGDNIELEANPYYFRGQPKIKKITYRIVPSFDTLATLMQTGEVQLWPVVPSAYIDRMLRTGKHEDGYRVEPLLRASRFQRGAPARQRSSRSQSHTRTRSTARNSRARSRTAMPSFKRASCRRSIRSRPHPSAIPLTPYDPAKAKQLLDQAGWKVGPDGIRVKNGQRLSLQFPYYTGSSSADDLVEFVRQALRTVGIDIQTRKYAPAMFFAPYQQNGIVYGGKWDMTIFSWQASPVADISNNWECNQIPPNGQNVSHFCNKDLDAMLEAVKATYDPARQRALLKSELQLIAANVPTIVLYVPQVGFTHSPNLTNFTPNAWTPFDNF